MSTHLNNGFNLFLLMLLFFFGLTACDSPQQDQNVETETSTSSSKDVSGLELEEYLAPLKLQIKQLESDLKESQSSALLAFEKNDNEQWNASKLQEKIIVLEENNRDLMHELEAQATELSELQRALGQKK